eukprot:Skav227150  [mRNA]  locus=scaffold133:654696:659315:+ [translate_table: standard]
MGKAQVHAVLVLLSIRALGKSKELVNQLPKEKRPVVPSSDFLSEDGARSIRKALMVHETFNLAQMSFVEFCGNQTSDVTPAPVGIALPGAACCDGTPRLQGENVPGNVDQLKELILSYGDEGEEVREWSGDGVPWENATNAPAVISGVGMLQHLLHATPRGIYWGFISARASALRLPQQTPEDLALMRLACLGRIQDVKGYKELRRAWDSLGSREQVVLVDHFLCDGLEERAKTAMQVTQAET